ncbi:hypothetical protein F3Y22_tig00117010pilonHSYRG00075 [Hibiscus syriacus]|uniref:Uncharacterized protein n=1 Tax=Hibiscus syriacus TaxID=106335 RepID=A0A6A2WF49_HIBSY|nr:hypothetical protein F3Y22_tig00117010pilonHSYRG00075 [Hibiscus syriacus]
MNLVAQGAALLQNALEGEKAAEMNDGDTKKRKALSDIGNTLAKPNVQRPNQRKKQVKLEIQLVPVATPGLKPENNAAPGNPKNVDPTQKPDNCPSESDIPLKLPRAMRSASSNDSEVLIETNADHQRDESTAKTPIATRTLEEKENCRH